MCKKPKSCKWCFKLLKTKAGSIFCSKKNFERMGSLKELFDNRRPSDLLAELNHIAKHCPDFEGEVFSKDKKEEFSIGL